MLDKIFLNNLAANNEVYQNDVTSSEDDVTIITDDDVTIANSDVSNKATPNKGVKDKFQTQPGFGCNGPCGHYGASN